MKMWGAVGFVPGAYNTSDHLQGKKNSIQINQSDGHIHQLQRKDLKSLVITLGTFILFD